jgi:hypothetical protein
MLLRSESDVQFAHTCARTPASIVTRLHTWISSGPQSIRLVLVLDIILDVAHFMMDCHKVLHVHFRAHLDPV